MNMNSAMKLENSRKQEFQVSCPFCSVGCRFKILRGIDEVIFSGKTQDVIDFDYQNPINEGALCPRGHFAYELLSHPMRLGRSYYKGEEGLTPEIPELIFQKIVKNLKANKTKIPLAVLINPMLSLHDIRATMDFALNNNIETIDFIAPLDRHLFRAMLDNPFEHKKCDDPRSLKTLNYSLCIGNVFTKQPVLSRHLLHAKYAFRQNALFSLNPIPNRTSWFGNIQLLNIPHTEPLYLAYLFIKIYNRRKPESGQGEFKFLEDLIEEKLKNLIQEYIDPGNMQYLDYIAEFLLSDKKSAIFYSTHHFNLLGSYLTGTFSSAISRLTDSYFVPLYTDGNFNAIEQLSKEIYPGLSIGKKPLLHGVLDNLFEYLFAVGWNPLSYLPGDVHFPETSKMIISSLVQDEYPVNTEALLPVAHWYEQMDLRTNFISWQSIGSAPVKSPIGSARPLAHYIYLLHQNASEQKVSLKTTQIPKSELGWEDLMSLETSYYIKKFMEIQTTPGIWMIPTEHVTHYKDASLTQYSSWARKDCTDEQMIIPAALAQANQVKENQHFPLEYNHHRMVCKARISSTLPSDRVVVHAHYLPVRKLIPGEFAENNKEYYFWCPKFSLKFS